MAREEYFVLIFFLTVGNLAHCQEWENLLFIKMEVLLEKQEAALVKQEAALSQLKGMQEKQEHFEGKLQEIQEKREHVEGKLQEMQEKLQHVEINLQEFHHELEHVKGAVNSNQDSLQNISVKLEALEEMQKKLGYVENNTEGLHRDLELVKGAVNSNQDSLQSAVNSNQDSLQNISAKLETLEEIHQETKHCLGREDLEHFKNISSAGQQELKSFLRQEISGVISLLETGGVDECSEGNHNCTDYEVCADKLFKYQCSCLPGFARDGSLCEDIDECTQGKNECSPQATCRNSVGSYSCSCNPPFEGDGRTCEFQCERPAKVLEGLGCVKLVNESKTFEEMNATCHQPGGRLLQDFSIERLQEVSRTFGYHKVWIGVYEDKWLESGLPLQEELWIEGSRGSESSRRSEICGRNILDHSSSSYKVTQANCSRYAYGYCQFLIPQK